MCKVIDEVQQPIHAGSAAGTGFQLVRLNVLAKIHDAALRTVHHHTTVFSVKVDEGFLALGVAQFHAGATFGSGLHVELEFKRAIVCHVFHALLSQIEVTDFLFLSAQGTEFLDRCGTEQQLTVGCGVEIQFTRQRIGGAILSFAGREIGILPVAHPRHGNGAVTGVGEADRGIVVLSPIQPFHAVGLGVAGEAMTVEVTHEIHGTAAAIDEAGIDVHNHHPLHALFVAIDGQLNEVGTLELIGLRSVAFAPLAHVGPVFEITAFVEAHVLVGADNHDPLLLRSIPEDLGVAEVLQSVEGCDDGVTLILGEGATVVAAVCHALHLTLMTGLHVAMRSVEGDDVVGSRAGIVAGIHHTRATEDVSHGVALNGYGQVLPVHEVATDGVPPVHVAPH